MLTYVQYVGVMRRLKTQHWRLSCKTRVGATVCNSCVCGSLVVPNIPHFLQGVLSPSPVCDSTLSPQQSCLIEALTAVSYHFVSEAFLGLCHSV